MNAMRKVLVVDDDPVVSKSFDRVLTRRGYLVVSAENGQDALSKIAHEEYDAVFTDIRMPGMDGLEVAEQMRAQRPWTPVVIITGYGSTENEARAEAAGVAGFLRKPLSPAMIESSLDAAVAATSLPRPTRPVAAGAAEPMRFTPEHPAASSLAAPAAADTSVGIGVALKNVALFLAAPFIGLGYVALFPLIGFVMLARVAGRAWQARHAASVREAAAQPATSGEADTGGVGVFLKNIVLFFAAPFIALAYVALFPFIGLVALAWTAGHACCKRSA